MLAKRKQGPRTAQSPSCSTSVGPENELVTSSKYPSELRYNRSDIGYTTQSYAVSDETDDLEYTNPARTTFHAREVETLWDPRKFDRLHSLNHGRGHTYEANSKRKSAVREEAKLKRCDAILQNCEISKQIRNIALKRVYRRDLRGFSRYYQGADGACVGFALNLLFDNAEKAKRSEFADRAASVVPGLEQDSVANLIEYTFKRCNENN